jgi:hypothetical protein
MTSERKWAGLARRWVEMLAALSENMMLAATAPIWRWPSVSLLVRGLA